MAASFAAQTRPRAAAPCRRCRRHRRCAGRGLCWMCYSHARASGTLPDWPRTTRTRDDVLDEWVILRREGHTLAQAAERLGMTRAAFDQALARARRARDPRALPPLVLADGTLVRQGTTI